MAGNDEKGADLMTVELLEPSGWTITEARHTVSGLRQVAPPGETSQAIELFDALCSYLDALYGDEFDAFLHPEDLSAVVAAIDRIRTAAPTGSPVPTDPDDLDDEDEDDHEVIIRLDQPVDSPVTLAEGRELANRLAATDDWPAELGRALIGLYGYLDQLYGGAGRCVELLSRSERAAVARVLAGDTGR